MNQTDQNNLSSLARLMAGQWKNDAIPPKWDGKTAERIVEHLEQVFGCSSVGSPRISSSPTASWSE